MTGKIRRDMTSLPSGSRAAAVAASGAALASTFVHSTAKEREAVWDVIAAAETVAEKRGKTVAHPASIKLSPS